MGKPRIIGITQARMGSTRLPGKVLMPAAGKPLLDWQLDRLARCRTLDSLIVATSDLPGDDALADHAARLGVGVFRGSETDVLDRFYRAALAGKGEIILRFTADCPLIDPALIDTLVAYFQQHDFDYAAIDVARFPRGLDAEIVTMAALETAWREAKAPFEREHVMPFLWQRPERFRLGYLTHPEIIGIGDTPWRWCVDTEQDFALVCQLLEQLRDRPGFGWRDGDMLMRTHPEWVAINRDVVQKALPDKGEEQ
ncbi:cytidylyltransferase domain-containing protein [Niveispirillum irakense]|uniref:cytidylyltransferase domain-containing protein n=1 Tax=Niveispirillum irakense TaxID=34011 RepID=UPI0004130602|nr:glycosyltransferase family protein [Niveispirillum irakense]